MKRTIVRVTTEATVYRVYQIDCTGYSDPVVAAKNFINRGYIDDTAGDLPLLDMWETSEEFYDHEDDIVLDGPRTINVSKTWWPFSRKTPEAAYVVEGPEGDDGVS